MNDSTENSVAKSYFKIKMVTLTLVVSMVACFSFGVYYYRAVSEKNYNNEHKIVKYHMQSAHFCSQMELHIRNKGKQEIRLYNLVENLNGLKVLSQEYGDSLFDSVFQKIERALLSLDNTNPESLGEIERYVEQYRLLHLQAAKSLERENSELESEMSRSILFIIVLCSILIIGCVILMLKSIKSIFRDYQEESQLKLDLKIEAETLKIEKHTNEVLNNVQTSYLNNVLKLAGDAIITINSRHRVVSFNSAAEQMFGWTSGEIVTKHFEDLLPESSRPEYQKRLDRFMKGKVSHEKLNTGEPILGQHKMGGEIWLEITISNFYREKKVICMLIIRDVSEKMKINKSLENSLKETQGLVEARDALLRETHHRVKNHLQVINSVLYFQEKAKSTTSYASSLQESRQRIQSMAILHESLYTTSQYEFIDLKDYLSRIASNTMQTMSVQKRISLVNHLQSCEVSMETALPCGLIMTELISNAFKHAFKDSDTGQISISLEEKEEGLLLLKVADTGVGIPVDLDISTDSGTLGLKLIALFVEQLDGRLERNTNGGTEIEIYFENLRYKKRY